jgi:hypothetical protein
MMHADLIDLEDFSERLRGLGVTVPSGADQQLVALTLESWLDKASFNEKRSADRLLGELEDVRGLMLPSVSALVHCGRACIKRNQYAGRRHY